MNAPDRPLVAANACHRVNVLTDLLDMESTQLPPADGSKVARHALGVQQYCLTPEEQPRRLSFDATVPQTHHSNPHSRSEVAIGNLSAGHHSPHSPVGIFIAVQKWTVGRVLHDAHEEPFKV